MSDVAFEMHSLALRGDCGKTPHVRTNIKNLSQNDDVPRRLEPLSA